MFRVVWIVLFWCVAGTAWGGAVQGPVRVARLQSRVPLRSPVPRPVQQDSFLTCFGDSLLWLANPGCFETVNPSQPGDCRCHTSHFFVQYMFPDLAVRHQVRGLSFFSNEDTTVFPSAGVLLLPIDSQGFVPFPTAQQLASLQARNVDTPGDRSVVFVDLDGANLVVPEGNNFAVVVALQFPNGQLTPEAVGDAIAIELEKLPDPDCDFFTIDGGQSGVWFGPIIDPAHPDYVPTDWGFVVQLDPIVSIQDLTWTNLKRLYRE